VITFSSTSKIFIDESVLGKMGYAAPSMSEDKLPIVNLSSTDTTGPSMYKRTDTFHRDSIIMSRTESGKKLLQKRLQVQLLNLEVTLCRDVERLPGWNMSQGVCAIQLSRTELSLEWKTLKTCARSRVFTI
jgi:hypothetical protein